VIQKPRRRGELKVPSQIFGDPGEPASDYGLRLGRQPGCQPPLDGLCMTPAFVEQGRAAPRQRPLQHSAVNGVRRLPDGTVAFQVADDDADSLRRQQRQYGVSEKELTYLTSAIASINVWNRFGAAYRWTPPVRQKAVGAAAS
jgi:hypothetical protein